MGKLEKQIEKIMNLDKNLRFDELAKVLIRLGYKQSQPKGGSSHYTFKKDGKAPITIPKSNPVIGVYVEMVKDALIEEGY